MKIAIVMPAFNEADSIPIFLTEISESFADHQVEILVVDDSSNDGTAQVLMSHPSNPIVHTNPKNLGHGPSYLRALRLACDLPVDVVVATDGDGQVSAENLLRIALALKTGAVGCAIGLRTERNEPLYRRIVSFLSHLLVFIKSGKSFEDSNSPHRAFSRDFLREYLVDFSGEETIPNILGTVRLLSKSIKVELVRVGFRDRLGPVKLGTSWGKTRLTQVPTLRFLKFCFRAASELIRR